MIKETKELAVKLGDGWKYYRNPRTLYGINPHHIIKSYTELRKHNDKWVATFRGYRGVDECPIKALVKLSMLCLQLVKDIENEMSSTLKIG